MTDPRRRRAAEVRDQVLAHLQAGPLDTEALWRRVRFAMMGYLEAAQLEYALQALRSEGKVSWERPRWRLA